MWNNLPFDLLASIFSYLPPDSFIRAQAACRNWLAASAGVSCSPRHSPWLVAYPTRSRGNSCYAYNPNANTWHVLCLDRVISPIKPIASIYGLVLVRVTTTTYLQLAISNPFTKQFATLPSLNVARTNPAVGLVGQHSNPCHKQGRTEGCVPGYKIYVAGGMSEAASSGAVYQPSIEMYDSALGKWEMIWPMPVEFAVRLTVWTPNESVWSNGILYWMTSARAYSVMGFEIRTNHWKELRAPMADRLEFAALVPRTGKLALVGGIYGADVCVWELGEDDSWCVIDKVPMEMVNRLLGNSKASWASFKCVGIDNGGFCLYRDLVSGIVVCREDFEQGKLMWIWIDGCCSIRGMYVHNLQVKELLLHPNLVCYSNF